ncbi:hypothetical protein BP6252_00061 [Coleophoma cylindrospora]|uniref:Ecp2 effector protein domain-containing protein n=1 Tax=Coleophoma cylindrospora TaxID=1849047 RepID=A0A3D8SNX4_9HELO|nr:hypothetical protein BP6252_00061 [Coleophoma cylindrospora]
MKLSTTLPVLCLALNLANATPLANPSSPDPASAKKSSLSARFNPVAIANGLFGTGDQTFGTIDLNEEQGTSSAQSADQTLASALDSVGRRIRRWVSSSHAPAGEAAHLARDDSKAGAAAALARDASPDYNLYMGGSGDCVQIQCATVVCATDAWDATVKTSLTLSSLMGEDCGGWTQSSDPFSAGQDICDDGLLKWVGEFAVWRGPYVDVGKYGNMSDTKGVLRANCHQERYAHCRGKSGMCPPAENSVGLCTRSC